MIGETLGHYKILDLLGAGGMGEVYRAEDLTLGREVALKVLPAELSSDPDRLARFEREAKTLAALDHPNIVTIHSVESVDVGEGLAPSREGKIPAPTTTVRFLTMQLVEGKPLSDLIPKGGTSLDRIFDIAIPLADALATAHEKGVIHRDLKPANIMVTDEGRVKVLDFGLAKLLAPTGPDVGAPLAGGQEGSSPSPTEAPTELLTEEGRILGTMPYMSPEQLEGKDLDSRTDVFSLGVILYEMATGERPFKGDSSASLISAIMTETPREVDSLRAEVPHHLARIIRRCLEKEPKRRYQAASDVRNELEDFHREISTGRGAVEPRRKRRGKTGMILALAAAVLVVTFGAWYLWNGRNRFSSEVALALEEVRLTPNPDDRPANGSLSPDGTLLAYRDPMGVYVLDIEAGEHRQLAEGSFRDLSWHPDGRSLLLPKRDDSGRYSIRKLSLLTGEHTVIQDHAIRGQYSPDGGSLAFLGDYFGEIWTTDSRGEGRETITTTPEGFYILDLVWSPNGLRLAYIQGETTASRNSAIMTVSLSDRNPRELVADDRLISPMAANGLVWLQNGELLYVLMDEAMSNSTGSSLWSIQVDEETGIPVGPSRKIRSWPEFQGDGLSASRDGTRIAIGKMQSRADVYVGELSDIGSAAGDLRKLTRLGSQDRPLGWLSDDELVLWSDRFGKSQVYRRRLESEAVLEPLVELPEDGGSFALGPKGDWFCWDNWLKDDDGEVIGAEVMRRAFAGGPAERVYTARGGEFEVEHFQLECSTSGAVDCLLSEKLGQDLVFFLFDPVEGKGREYGRLNLEGDELSNPWALSSDGKRIALPFTDTSIVLYDFDLREHREVEVSGMRYLAYLGWLPGRSALVVTGNSAESQTFAAGVLELDGSFAPLWTSASTFFGVPIPSPDGRFVAVKGTAISSEIWLLCEDCPGS